MERLTYHREAREEIKQAARFYESCKEGLGDKYLVAVENAIERLTSDPFRYRTLRGKFRRCLVKYFPFGIIYAVLWHHVCCKKWGNLHRRCHASEKKTRILGRPAIRKVAIQE